MQVTRHNYVFSKQGEICTHFTTFYTCAPLQVSTANCCIKLRLFISLLSNPDLKLICFLLHSAKYCTCLFRHRLCSRITALWRYM